MTALKKILHPTDFSAGAEDALLFAIDLAHRTGAELHVSHVVFGGRDYWGEADLSEAADFELKNRIHEVVLKALESIPASPGFETTHELIAAPTAAEGIVRHVREGGMDLVVMGTHGRTGIRKLIMGSVATEVIRAARCDVITVPAGSIRSAGRLLVPVDLLERSKEVISRTRDIAALYHSGIDLIHVLEMSERGPEMIGPGALTLRQVAVDRLFELAQNTGGWDNTRVYVHRGQPVEEIVEFASRRSPRLLVMASSGMTPMERIRRNPAEQARGEDLKWRLGRITSEVVMRSPAPVWLLKRFEDQDGYSVLVEKKALEQV